MPITCVEFRRLLSLNPVPQPQVRDFEEHLAACSACRDLSSGVARTFPSPLPKLPDHYADLEVIGHGGMGIVYRALDIPLDRIVAIKVMQPGLAVQSDAWSRFMSEARALAAITNEHVVKIFHVSEEPPYIVMQYICGESLRARMDRERLSHGEICRIGVQVARGLEAAHSRKLIHRDIKPGNIMLQEGDSGVFVTDFGLARAADAPHLTRAGTVVGTAAYMSPEQTRGESLTPQSDQWSLGVVLYEMLAGHRPFRGDTTLEVMRKIREDPVPPIPAGDCAPPAALVAVVHRLLSKRSQDRYPDARAVAEALASVTAPIDPPPPPKLWRLLVLVGLLALFAAMAVDWWFWSRPVSEHTRLTRLAWEAIDRHQWQVADARARECIALFEPGAKRDHKQLVATGADIPKPGRVGVADRRKIDENGTINDVATCWFIAGIAARQDGREEAAVRAYEKAATYPLSRCFNPDDQIYFSPAEAAEDRLLSPETLPPPLKNKVLFPDWVVRLGIFLASFVATALTLYAVLNPFWYRNSIRGRVST